MISELSSFISDKGASAFAALLGEDSRIVTILSTNPLLIPMVLLGIVLVIFGIFLFVDFIKDSWKMPFGILLDLIALVLAVKGGYFALLFAFISAGIFYTLSLSQNTLRWVYAGIGFLKFFILLSFIPIPENLNIILLFIPICTIAMFFVCITD